MINTDSLISSFESLTYSKLCFEDIKLSLGLRRLNKTTLNEIRTLIRNYLIKSNRFRVLEKLNFL